MTERQERLAREREDIAARVAKFKATQKKFEREREEYFATTLENALSGSGYVDPADPHSRAAGPAQSAVR